ncbi:MAG: hypothetical protein KC713_05610, partial [Candidatus Omnitrophica bacterium]|nr:hypothetical protein [Candidatus Omnitrophota bacterium]
YFVLSNETVNLIKKIRQKRKIDIVVSTNSLAATDNVYAYAMLYKDKKLYIKDLHMRLFELKPVPDDFPHFIEKKLLTKNLKSKKGAAFFNRDNEVVREYKFLCIHAKNFVVDSRWAWVGSFNADIRSEMINTETAVIINDKKIATFIKDKIKRICHPRNSWTVAPKKHVPVITEVNDELSALSSILPLVDLWPFNNVTCFELKDGFEPVTIFDEGFYDHYESVGSFPHITSDLVDKEIKIRLMKTFGKIIKPIV